MNKQALVLLSGGIDSATTLAIAKDAGFEITALTFDYGQRHIAEITCAKKLAKSMKIKTHRIMHIDLREIGGSALTDNIDVPDYPSPSDKIPITYVPARNTIFLSYALAWSEVLKINDIFIGANVIDYSGYPDCRPEYITAFETLANLATKSAIEGNKFKIHAPLIKMTKAEIIKKGTSLGIDYSLTHSCYNPDSIGNPCGQCDSCRIRRKGFQEVNGH